MKIVRWVAVCLILLFVCPGAAQAEENEDWGCPVIASRAKIFMEARQGGMPLQQLLGYMDYGRLLNYETLLKGMAVKAYEFPIEQTKEEREEAIFCFQFLYYDDCTRFPERY